MPPNSAQAKPCAQPEAEEKQQRAYDASRKIKTALVRAKAALESGNEEIQEEESLEKLIVDTVGATADRNPREANLQNKVEEFVRHRAFVQFLEDGSLLPPSSTPFATDEEYLAGACMGLSQDLATYGEFYFHLQPYLLVLLF